MTTIQAVVLDIGNVLIAWQPEKFYDRVIGKTRRQDMFAQVDLHGMNELVDLGHEFKSTIYETADRYPAWRDEIRLWHDRWIEMAQPAIQPTVALLRVLRGNGIPVFALSNFGIGSFAYARSIYQFLDEFDQYFISGHLGVTKPDQTIYQHVEQDSGLTGSALLFADDRLDNIQAAAQRGWRTHHFSDPHKFAGILRDEGLISAQSIQQIDFAL